MVFVSVASGWEMAIKSGLGKLRLSETFAQGMARGGFDLLAIDYAHLERLAMLPQLHRDPFDRMLVAQAQVERLTIVSSDPALANYGVPVVAG
jgi:PIN domain nuclease of toxin-antitoxin system